MFLLLKPLEKETVTARSSQEAPDRLFRKRKEKGCIESFALYICLVTLWIARSAQRSQNQMSASLIKSIKHARTNRRIGWINRQVLVLVHFSSSSNQQRRSSRWRMMST